MNSHAILGNNYIRYVLEGKKLYEAKPKPRAITFLLIHNECNYFPNCTRIHVITYTNAAIAQVHAKGLRMDIGGLYACNCQWL